MHRIVLRSVRFDCSATICLHCSVVNCNGLWDSDWLIARFCCHMKSSLSLCVDHYRRPSVRAIHSLALSLSISIAKCVCAGSLAHQFLFGAIRSGSNLSRSATKNAVEIPLAFFSSPKTLFFVSFSIQKFFAWSAPALAVVSSRVKRFA